MYSITPLELKAAAQKLPPSPEIFGKLSKMLKSRDTGMRDIVELVNTDSSLTAKVLKISNSAAYNTGSDPINNLDQAIQRIGFRELFKVVGMAASSNGFPRRSLVYNVDGSLLWENSVATGLAMEYLAKAAGEDEQEAYTLGLLKSMGKMIIETCSRKFIVAPKYFPNKGATLVEWEQEKFEMTNAVAASLVLQAWNFPETAYQTLEFQYDPDMAPSANRLSRLLNIANGVAEKVGKSIPGESGYWALSEDCLADAELNENHVEAAAQYVQQRMGDIVTSMVN
ncbi:MAG: HDOD domain-containing protein [Verrucomicrobiota bacterium]